MKLKKIVLLLFTLSIAVSACKKKNSQTHEPDLSASFDKQALLVNMADKVILPDYLTCKELLDSMQNQLNSFKINTDLYHLHLFKQSFDKAYIAYQSISLYGFGPAEDLSIRSNCNIFPTSVNTITSNINSELYNLELGSNLAAKGFPALDYLIYGKNQTEEELVNIFKNDVKRFKYTEALLSDMLIKLSNVISTWQSNYRQTFVNSLGTDLGSSIGFLVNQLNYELDYLKNYKIATPLGLRSAGVPLPDKCEAYYGGQSVQYALETLLAIEDMYLGRQTNGENGLSFDDYLDHLKAKHVSTSLNQAINTQFSLAKAALLSVPNPLSEQVVTNSALVKRAHDEIAKLIVLLKTDMPSALGVVITYQDGDGD